MGLGWSPLTCGGGYWRHGGAVPGYLGYEGFTGNGRRGVVLVVSTMYRDEGPDHAQQRASERLVDDVLCGR